MVDAAQGGVVDDAVGAVDEGREAGEAVHGGAGFAAGRGDPFDVEDDAAVHVVGAGGDEDELGAPGDLAVAFDVESTVGVSASGDDLTRGRVDARVAGRARKRGVMTLPSAWSMRDRSGWVHDPGPSGREVRVRVPGRRRSRDASVLSAARTSGSVR